MSTLLRWEFLTSESGAPPLAKSWIRTYPKRQISWVFSDLLSSVPYVLQDVCRFKKDSHLRISVQISGYQSNNFSSNQYQMQGTKDPMSLVNLHETFAVL